MKIVKVFRVKQRVSTHPHTVFHMKTAISIAFNAKHMQSKLKIEKNRKFAVPNVFK